MMSLPTSFKLAIKNYQREVEGISGDNNLRYRQKLFADLQNRGGEDANPKRASAAALRIFISTVFRVSQRTSHRTPLPRVISTSTQISPIP